MLSKIGLLTPPTRSHRTAEETLAIGYLASILRQTGHSVVIVDGWLEHLSVEEMVSRLAADGSPDLIGMSCYHSNLEQAAKVLKAIRNRFGDIPSICGGYGPTFHPELFINSGFDVVVLGEAEHTIVQLVNALLMGQEFERTPGIVYRASGQIIKTPCVEPIAELDLIPFPSRDTIAKTIEQRNPVHICTSRGCTGHCHFCSVIALQSIGPRRLRWRGRSIQNIVGELVEINHLYGVTHFKFVDDSFIESPRNEQWAHILREELARLDLHIKFRTQIRADRLTPELASILKDCGWFSTSIGIENGSATALKRMGKSASLSDNLNALDILEENGIYAQMGMILFDPETTLDELRENLVFLRSHSWPVNKGIFTEMYAAEGTPFTKQLSRRGQLLSEYGTHNYGYLVKDPSARRAYTMLKQWHRSHSFTYDWTIDALTAPKVLPDGGYALVHALCRRLQDLDLEFFEAVLRHISMTSDKAIDVEFTLTAIDQYSVEYASIQLAIEKVYRRYGLCYVAEPNPFLYNTLNHRSEGQ